MVQVISFPGLGIGEITLNRAAFTLFGFPIYWYGIIIAVGFLLGIGYILRRCPEFGLDSDRALDVLLGVAVGGIVGARIYYVVFSGQHYTLMDILRVRDGGLAIYGGVIGGFLTGVLMCRLRKVRFLPMADATVGGVILGQAIGRWGNFFNVEAFGSNTTLPWGMAGKPIADYLSMHQQQLAVQGIQVDPSLPVHPTFFYESMWCLAGFFVLAGFVKRRTFDGEVTLLYLAWYGAGRAFIEGLRTDSLMWGRFRVSQMLAVLLVVLAAALILYQRARLKNAPAALYANTEEGRENAARCLERRKGNNKAEDEPVRECAAEEDAEGERPFNDKNTEDGRPGAAEAAKTGEPAGNDDNGEEIK